MNSELHEKAVIGLKKSPIGKAKKASMILVHANKHELDELDKAQGEKSVVPGTDIRSYKKLGKHFKHPEVQRITLEASRLGRAKGGSIEKLKKNGRHGDTELALFPVHMADHFDRMMGKRSINPIDKKREYFDFSSFANGLSNMLGGNKTNANSSTTPSAAPTDSSSSSSSSGSGFGSLVNGLGNAASGVMNMLNKPINSGGDTGSGNSSNTGSNPTWGNLLGEVFKNTAGNYIQSKLPQGDGNTPSWQKDALNGLFSGLTGFMDAKQKGSDLQGALTEGALKGLNTGLQNQNNTAANAVKEGINSYQKDGNLTNAVANGAVRGLQDINSPYAKIGQEAIQNYQKTGDAQGALTQGALQGGQQLANQYGNGALANAFQGMQDSQRNGGNMYDMMQQGALSGLQSMNSPYARIGQNAIQNYQNTGNFQGALTQGALQGAGQFANQYGYGPLGNAFHGMANAQNQGYGLNDTLAQGALYGLSSYLPQQQQQMYSQPASSSRVRPIRSPRPIRSQRIKKPTRFV
jgi:hypothetical protein